MEVHQFYIEGNCIIFIKKMGEVMKEDKTKFGDLDVRKTESKVCIFEEPILAYSEREVEGCTVIPKGTFILFEGMNYCYSIGVDTNKISSSGINEKKKELSV